MSENKKQKKIIGTDGTVYTIRKEVLNGIKVKIWRFKCKGCGGELDAYYLDKEYSIPELLKMEEVKKLKKELIKNIE